MPDDSKDKPGPPNASAPGLQNPPVRPEAKSGGPGGPQSSAAPPAPLAPPPDLAMLFAQLAAHNLATLNKPSAARVDADESVPGGHFVTAEGEHVNAWGEPFKDGRDGSVDNPELPRGIR